VKLYSFYSKDYGEMWDRYFVPSIPKSLELVKVEVPESLDRVLYGEGRFWEMSKFRTEQRIRIIRENLGKSILITGCDMMFFGNPVALLERELKKVDFLAPDDSSNTTEIVLCTDFEALNCTPEMLSWHEFLDKVTGNQDDQAFLNKYRDRVKWKVLPRDLFWNIGLNRFWQWNQGEVIPKIPENILYFHANYTIGKENKLALLAGVSQKVSERKAK